MPTMTTHRSIIAALFASLTITLSGCDDGTSAEGSSGQPGTTASESVSPSWLLADMPDGAKGVAELKTVAAENDSVVLIGRIGGSVNPLSPASPVFTVVDVAIPSCADNPEDRCGTPWDYCCEPRDLLVANSATIQLTDASGNPLVANPAAVLSPLDEIVVIGTVAPRPNSEVLVIKAIGIHRVGG